MMRSLTAMFVLMLVISFCHFTQAQEVEKKKEEVSVISECVWSADGSVSAEKRFTYSSKDIADLMKPFSYDELYSLFFVDQQGEKTKLFTGDAEIAFMGSLLVTCRRTKSLEKEGGKLELWDGTKLVASNTLGFTPISLKVSDDSIWIRSFNGEFFSFGKDLKVGKTIKIPSTVTTFAVSPDGKYIAASYPVRGRKRILDGYIWPRKYKVQVWNISGDEPNKTLSFEHNNTHALEFSRDGKLLAIGGLDYVLVYRTKGGTLLKKYWTGCGDQDIISGVRFSPDNTKLLIGVQAYMDEVTIPFGREPYFVGGWVSVYSLKEGKTISLLYFAPRSAIRGLHFGALVKVASSQRTATISGHKYRTVTPEEEIK